MSAFVVSKEHIDALLSVAIEGPSEVAPNYWHRPFRFYVDGEQESRVVTLDNADEVGAMLWGTNALSVRSRYPDIYDGGEYPGPIGFTLEGDVYEYRYTRPRRKPNPVEALKAIACYEYQSCEFSGWEEHAAFAFCEYLRKNVISTLHGYSDAPWEWTDAKATA